MRRRLGGDRRNHQEHALFRSSRPDSIETGGGSAGRRGAATDCSGLLGRTPLRLPAGLVPLVAPLALFRSSRPDSIETDQTPQMRERVSDCSGLLGRTPLRLRPWWSRPGVGYGLFRSSRPDSIETAVRPGAQTGAPGHCSGLLGRTPLRPPWRRSAWERRVIVPVF